MRLLLVEDHEQNGLSFLRMLQANGYADIDWQRDGITGLEAGVNGSYVAMIIDLDLPGLDGMHVALALYRRMLAGHIPHTPLIALSARTDPATRHEASRIGFRAWIGKPCTEAALLTTLEQAIDAELWESQ